MRPLPQMLAAMGGALGGSRAEVDAFLRGFERFAFLWQRDAAAEYDAFIAAAPTLEARPARAPLRLLLLQTTACKPLCLATQTSISDLLIMHQSPLLPGRWQT